MNVLGVTDERRKLTAALLASLAVHCIVVLVIFWLAKVPIPTLALPSAPEPVRIRIVEAPQPPPQPPLVRPTPQPPPQPRFADSNPNVPLVKPPPSTITQSDVDSVAAAPRTGSGASNRPQLDGKNERSLATTSQQLVFSPGADGQRSGPDPRVGVAPRSIPTSVPPTQLAQSPTPIARSSPSPKPTPVASPSPTPQQRTAPRREIAFNELPRPSRTEPAPQALPLMTEVPDALVVLDPSVIPTPAPAEQAPPGPEPTARTLSPSASPARLALESAATRGGRTQEQRVLSKLEGGSARTGRASFDAVGTPLGRYRKLMAQSINARWQAYVARQMDLVTLGTVRIRFDLLEDGTVQNVEIVSNDANSTLATLSIQAIMEAKIPPLPPDLVGALRDGRLEIEYTFNVW